MRPLKRSDLAGTTKLAKNKLDALVLYVRIRLVRQVGSDIQAVSGITDRVTLYMVSRLLSQSLKTCDHSWTYVSANIQSLANPVVWDASNQDSETIDILGGGAAVGVDIACQTSFVVRVAKEENTLDSIEGSTSKFGHGINSSGRTLRVALQDEASVRVGL